MSTTPSRADARPRGVDEIVVFKGLPGDVAVPDTVGAELPVEDALRTPFPPFFEEGTPLGFRELSADAGTLDVRKDDLVAVSNIVGEGAPDAGAAAPLEESVVMTFTFPHVWV